MIGVSKWFCRGFEAPQGLGASHKLEAPHKSKHARRGGSKHDEVQPDMTRKRTVSNPSSLCNAGANFAYTSIRISSAGGIDRKRIDCASDDRSWLWLAAGWST